MGMRSICAACIFAAWFCLAPAGVHAAGSSGSASCAAARSAFTAGRPEQAQEEYLAVLAADPSAQCAINGLNEVTVAFNTEERLCAEAAALAKAGKAERAEAKYAKALSQNVASECARKGLAPPDSNDFWDDVGAAIAYLPKIPPALGALFLIPLAAIALLALGIVVYLRWRRASLVVRAFADAAVKPALGAGISALVERQLVGLSRRGEQSHDGLDLDFVVADVELLAEDEQLAGAVGSMAEVPQLGLVMALLELGDRLIPSHRLAVGGELLPAGSQGAGISLALYRRNGVRARGVLWYAQVRDWMPGAAPLEDDENVQPEDPSPYYDLAAPAASWVQYEAARSINSNVSLITTDARSFALMGTGIALQRKEKPLRAMDAYAQALAVDPENVAALTNLGNLIARLMGFYVLTVFLLDDARQSLEESYREAGEA